jgi:hypothetical protein
MNPEIKALWLAALRSGEYEQGKGYLNRSGTFCCLGVLCDLAVKQGVEDLAVETKSLYGGSAGSFVTYNSDSGDLPEVVREWAGLDGVSTQEVETWEGSAVKHPLNLVDLNDDKGYTFAEIADVIERDL